MPDPNNNTPGYIDPSDFYMPENSEPVGAIDPVSLAINSDLTKDQANEEGFIVRPMTLEESWETNRHLLEPNITMSSFPELYKQVYSKSIFNNRSSYIDDAANRKYEVISQMAVDIPKKMTLIAPEVLGYTSGEVEAYRTNMSPGKIGERYNMFGQKEYTMTADETAEGRNFYLKPDGGRGNMNDFHLADHMGTPFKYNADGTKTMLVLDEQRRVWVEKPSDAVLASRKVRSIHGPQEAESGILENIGVQAYNTIIDETIGAAGTVSEVFGMAPMLWGDKSYNSFIKWGREMQNYAGGIRSKVSEAVEQEGAFGSWRAGLGTTANALTQVGSQALVGFITRGASAPLTAAAKTSKGVKWLQRALNTTPWAFGASYAMQAMNEEAKAIGASDEARALLSLAAGGAVFLSEKLLHMTGAKGLVDMFEDRSFTGDINRLVRADLAATAKRVLDDTGNLIPGGREIFEKEIKKIYKRAGIDLNQKVSKNRIRQMATNASNWMRYSDKPGSLVARFKGMLSGGLEEGTEEVLEAIFNGATKTIYNEGFADPNAEPGKGKFDNPFGEVSFSSFAAGFIGGGVMGAIRGVGKKHDLKGLAVANIATNMTLEQGKAFYMDLHSKGILGNPMLTMDGQFINSLPKDQQAKAKSVNDLMLEQHIAQLEQAHSIMQSTGLSDPELLSRVLNDDKSLQRDVLMKYMENVKLKKEQASLEAKISQMKEDDPGKVALLKKLNEVKGEIANNAKFADEVMDGTAQEKYKAIMTMRTLELQRNALSSMTAKELVAMDEKARNKLYEEKLLEAEKTDNWVNRDKAIARIKKIQEWNAEYKKAHDEVEGIRQRGSESVTTLDSAMKMQDPLERAFLIMENLEATSDNQKVNVGNDGALASTRFGAYLDQANKDTNQLKSANEKKIRESETYKKLLSEEEKRQIQAARDAVPEGGDGFLLQREIDAAKEKAKEIIEGKVKSGLVDFDSVLEDDPDFAMQSVAEFMEEDLIEERKGLVSLSDRIFSFRSNNVYDDNDKMLVRGSEVFNDPNLGQNFSGIHDMNDPKFKDATMYTVEIKDGFKAFTTEESYEEAKAKGEEQEDGSIVHDGMVYRTEQSKASDGRRIVEFKVGEDTRTSKANRLSMAGQGAVMALKRDREVKELFLELEAMQGDPDQDLVDKTKALRDAIADDLSTLELVMELAQRGILSEKGRAWLGFDVNTNQLSDLIGLYDAMQDAHDSVKNLYFIMSHAADQRELNFRELSNMQVKWNAYIMNQLADKMPEIEVKKNGVVLERPQFPTVEQMTENDLPNVVKAMQYWHLYFQQMPADQLDRNIKIFWHEAVGGMVVEYDEQNNPIFTEQPINPDAGKNLTPIYGDEGEQINDFFNLLEWENFVGNKTKSGDTPFKRIVYYDLLNMMLNADPQEIYQGMLDVLDDPEIDRENAKFAGAHTSEQLMIALPLFTHIVENQRIKKLKEKADKGDREAIAALAKHQAFKNTIKGGATQDPEAASGLWRMGGNNPYHDLILDNIRLVTGAGGSGKTTFLTMTALQFALNKGYTTKGNVILVAPNEFQLNELKESVKLVGFEEGDFKIMLVDDFIALKDSGQLKDKFIIVDEISLLSPKQKAKIYGTENKDYVNAGLVEDSKKLDYSNTVIIMGDELQPPLDPVEDNELGSKGTEHLQHGMNLTQVKRTDVKQVFFLQAGFRRGIHWEGGNAPIFGDTFLFHVDKDGTQKGVRNFDEKDDFFNNLNKRIAENDKVVLIVYNEDDHAEALGRGIPDKNIYIMRDINRTPQGRSFDEVYVYAPRDGGMKELDQVGAKAINYYNRYMAMAVGRARRFVAIYTGDGMITHKGSKEVDDARDVKEFVKDDDEKWKAKKKKLYDQMQAAANATTPVSKAQVEANKAKAEAEQQQQQKEDNKEPVLEEEKEPAFEEDVEEDEEGVVTQNNENKNKKKKSAFEMKRDQVVSNYGDGKVVNFKDHPNVTITDLINVSSDPVNPEWFAFFRDSTGMYKARIGFDKGQMVVFEITNIEEELETLREQGELDDNTQEEAGVSTAEDPEVSYEALDTKDGGSIEFDHEVKDPTASQFVSDGVFYNAEYGLFFKVGADIRYRFKGQNFKAKVLKIYEEDGKVYITYETANKTQKTTEQNKLAKGIKEYVEHKLAENTKLSEDQDIIRLLQFEQLSALNFYSPFPNHGEWVNTLKNNLEAVYLNQNVAVTVVAKRGGVYYDNKGIEHKAAYTLEIRMNGRTVGFIPIAAVQKDVTSFKDKSAYYEVLRDWVIREMPLGTDSKVIYSSVVSNPLDAIGDVVRYVDTSDKSKSRPVSEIIEEIEVLGGEVLSLEQVDNKTILSFKYLRHSPKVHTIELEANKLLEEKDKAKKIINEHQNKLLDIIEGVTGQSEINSVLAKVDRSFVNFNLSQLAADLHYKAPYAVDLYKQGIIEIDNNAEPITSSANGEVYPRVKIKTSDTSGQPLKRVERYLDFLDAIYVVELDFQDNEIESGILVDSTLQNGFNLRIPTVTSESGTIDHTKESLSLKTVNNVEVTTPKMNILIDLKRVMGLSKDSGTGDGEAALHKKQTDQINKKYYDLTLDQVQEEAREILGNDFGGVGFEQLDGLHGKLSRLGKILMNYNGQGMSSSRALYHEIAHYVAEFLMSRAERNQLYEEIGNRMKVYDWMNNPVSRRAIAEEWAEMGERYASNRRNLTGISKFLRRMMDDLLNFFRKIGLYKSLTQQYLYDTYVMKKYRGVEGEALVPSHESLEDIYGDALNKVDDYADYNAVAEHYGDRDNAKRSQHTVNLMMSKFITIPSLSKRSFIDSQFLFKDMINRVEYSLRQQLMFETDDAGQLIKDSNGMPKLREDALGNTLRVSNAKSQPVPLFRWESNYTDPSTGEQHVLPVLMYFDKKKNTYVKAPMTDNGLYFFEPKDRNMIRKSMTEALQMFKIETQDSDGKGGFKLVGALDGDPKVQARVRKSEDLKLIQIAGTIKDEVILGMIQHKFPSVEVKKLYYDRHKRNTRFGEVVDRVINTQDSVARKDANEIAPMDRMSAMVRFVVSSIPLHVYENGKWVPTDKFVNYETVQSIMDDLPMMMYNPRVGGSVDHFRIAMLEKIRSMRVLLNAGDTFEDERWVALNSIYQTLFSDTSDPDNLSHAGMIELMNLAMMPDTDLKFIYDRYTRYHDKQKDRGIVARDEEPLSMQEFFSNLPNRAEQAYHLLSSIALHFGSIAKDSYAKATQFSAGGKAKVYINDIESKSLSENKDKLNRNIDALMFASDGSVGVHYLNLFGFNESGKELSGDTNYGAYTLMRNDGIYYNDKVRNREVKIIDISEDGKFTVVNTRDLILAGITPSKVIRSMLREAYGENVYMGYADRLAVPREDSRNVIGWEDFADMVGPIMTSAYLYTADKYYGQNAASGAPHYDFYKKALESFAGKDSRYGKTTEAALRATRVENEASEDGRLANRSLQGESFFFPTAFFNEVGLFSKFLTVTQGGKNSDVGRTVREKRVYLKTVQDMAGYRFTDGGKQMIDNYKHELRNDQNLDDINHIGKRVNNPFFRSPDFAKKYDFIGGYKKGNLGRELSQFTNRDNWDYALDNFMKDAGASIANWKGKINPLMFANHGDRGRQKLWSIDFKKGGIGDISGFSNGLLEKVEIEGKPDFVLDSQNVMAHVLNNYRIAIKAQAKSINKWVNFFAARDRATLRGLRMEAGDIITDEDLSTAAGYDKVLSSLRKVNAFLKEFDAFSNPEINEPVELLGSDLKTGEDFIVLRNTKSDKGKVVPGITTRLFGDIKGETVTGNYINLYSPVKWLSSSADGFMLDDDVKSYDGKQYPTLAHAALDVDDSNKVFDGRTSEKLLFKLFTKDLREANRLAKKDGFKLYAEQIKTQQKIDGDYVEGFMTRGNRYYTPMAAMVMGHSLANAYHMFAFEGTYANHVGHEYTLDDKGTTYVYTTNANKRFMQHSSTFQIPNWGGHKTIDVKTKTLHISEPILSATIHTASKDGSIENAKHSPFDGQGFTNPLHDLMLWHSMGGAHGPIGQTGNRKTVSVQSKTGNFYKHALDRPTFQSMDLMPEQRKLVEIMLNPTAKPVTDAPIRYWSDLGPGGEFQANDSLWQRYLIYERESHYYKAVDQMKKVIDDHGGIINFLKENPQYIYGKSVPYKPEQIEDLRKSYESSMENETRVYQYDTLRALLSMSGRESDMVEVNMAVSKGDGNWAMEQLLDFYADTRAKLKHEGIDAQEVYPYISHIEIADATVKQKAQTLSMPVYFNYAGQSQLMPIKSMRVGDKVPVDLFTAYAMHQKAGVPMNLGNFLQDRNNLEEGVQLEANRSFDDSLEAPMVQMMTLLLSSPHLHQKNKELAKEMMDTMADIMSKAIEKYERGTSDLRIKDEEKYKSASDEKLIHDFLKNMVKINISKQDDNSMMSVIIQNDKIHISTSLGTEERMYQYLASYFRKNVVKRKSEAMRLVQASGMMVELYEYADDNGNVQIMSLSEAKRYAMRNLGMTEQDIFERRLPMAGVQGTKGRFFNRGLKQTVIRMRDGVVLSPNEEVRLSEMSEGDRIRYLIENNKAEIIPGEIVIPGAKFEKYGIPKATSLNELFKFNYYDGDGNPLETLLYDTVSGDDRAQLKEMLTKMVRDNIYFETTERRGKTRTTVKYGENVVYGENPYFDTLFHDSFKHWLKGNQGRVKEIERAAKQELIASFGGVDAYVEMYKDNPEQMKEDLSKITTDLLFDAITNDTEESFPDLVNMMADGLIAVKLTTEQVLGVRTPSGPGSSFFNKVVAIINDNASTGYVNTIKNEIDGSDMDIDQFTLYYLSDTMEELGYSKDEIDAQKEKWKLSKDHDALLNEEANELNNRLMKLVFEYYKDPKATGMTMSAIGMDSIKEASRGSYESMFPYGDHAGNLGHTIAMRGLSMDGKAVGPSANAQKGQNYFMAAYQALANGEAVDASIMPISYNFADGKFLSSEKYKDIPRRVEGLTNAATDNPKLMILGSINVNISNMSTVANAHFANKILIEFVEKNRSRFGIPERNSTEFALEMAKPKSNIFNADGSVNEEYAVYAFFKGEAHSRIFERIKSVGSVKDGKRAPNLFKAAHTYYSALVENQDKYQDRIKEADKTIDQEIDNIRAIMKDLIGEEEFNRIAGEDASLDFDAIKVMRQLAKKASKKDYLALSKMIRAQIRGDLMAFGDAELNKAIEAKLAETRKSYVYDAFEVMDEANAAMGIKDSKEAEVLLTKTKAYIEKMSSLFKSFRAYQRALETKERNSRLVDDSFKQEVLILAKYAFFGDWMDRWVDIVGINQFGISSAYDAYKYKRNLKLMTGYDLEELIKKYDEYKSGNYNSPAAYFDKVGRITKEQRVANGYRMMQHNMANADYRHMTEKIGEGEAAVDYMNDFHGLAEVAEMLFALPPIMESIRSVLKVDGSMESISLSQQQQYRELLDSFADDVGRDMWTERQYRTFFEQAHKYETGRYLSNPIIQNILNDALDEYGLRGKPLIGVNDSGKVPNILTVVDADTFLMQFPLFFQDNVMQDLYNRIESGELTNESMIYLLKHLRVKRRGTYSYLEIANPVTFTPQDMVTMREGFKALPQHVQNLLAIYQLAKDGFSYKSSAFLSQIVNEEWYEDFSDHIEKVKNKPLDTSSLEYFKMMVLSNPKLGLLRRSVSVKVDGVWQQQPPLASYGPARYYDRQVHFEMTKWGKKEQRALAVTTKNNMVMASRSDAVAETGNIIPATEFVDVQNMPSHYSEFDGVGLPGLKIGAHFNWIIKGNLQRLIDERVSKAIKNGEKPDMKAIRAEVLDVDWLNNNYMAEYRKEAYRFKKEAKTKSSEQINKEIANEYQLFFRDYFSRMYKDDSRAFNNLVEKARGKVITDPYSYTEAGVSYQLSSLFNQLIQLKDRIDTATRKSDGKDSDKTFYDLMKEIRGVPETYIPPVEEKYYLNRHTGRVGIFYRENDMSSQHVLEINPYARVELQELLEMDKADRLLSVTDVKDIVLGFNTGDKDLIRFIKDDPIVLDRYRKNFANVKDLDTSLEGDDFRRAIIHWIANRGTRKHLESNIDFQLANNHAIAVKGESIFTMNRRNPHTLREGDLVYFKDNEMGVVTAVGDFVGDLPTSYNYILVNPPKTRRSRVRKAKFSLEDHIDSANAKNGLESLVRTLSASLGDQPYKFITDVQQAKMGVGNDAVSFYHNGVVYINTDRADLATAVHEFAHPYVLALKNERPLLYQAIAASVRQDKELMEWVRREYPELLTEDEILMEAIPTFIQMRYYAQQYYSQSETERMAWDDYFDWVKSTFTQAVTGSVDPETKLEDLDFSTATLGDIADAIIADLKFPGVIPWLSNRHYSHAVPYTMKAKSTSKVKNISLSNLDQLIQRKADYSDAVEKERIVLARIDRAIAEGQPFVGLSGSYNFKHTNPAFNVNGKIDWNKRAEYKNKALKAEIELMDKVSDKMLDFLNTLNQENMNIVSAAKNTVFPGMGKSKKDQEDESVFEKQEQMLTTMLIEMNFNPATDKAMSLKDAMKDLGIKLPTNIKVNDEPIVIIHNKGLENQAISIMNITTTSLMATGAMDKKPMNQAFAEEAGLDPKERRDFKKVNLNNTTQDINALRNGVIAMAISKANPNIQIRRVGTMMMMGFESKPFKKHYMEMEDLVQQIKNFFEPKVLRNGLERDLYELVTDEEITNPDRYRTDYLDKLGRYLRSALAQQSNEDKRKSQRLQEALDILQHVQEDDTQAKMPALAKAIKARLDYLRIEVLNNDTELVAKSTEYQDLAYTYLQLTGYNEINTKKVTPNTFDEQWVDTVDRWHGQVKNWVFDSLDKNLRQSKEQLIPYQEELNRKVQTLININPQVKGVTDTSHALFRKLFKTREVKDADGNTVTVSLHEIHHDINDPETQEALRQGVITEEELDFGKWLADQMYEEFVRYVMDVERSKIQNSHNDLEEELRARAIQEVDTRYKKGMMPVFIQTGASALSEGNIKKAFEIYTKTAGSWYGGNIFDEYTQSTEDDLQRGAFHKLLSPFWSQFNSVDNYGSDKRLRLLGLGRDGNNNLVLLNPKKQNTLSFNLQNIGLFTTAASMRARYLKEGVAHVNIALDLLRGEQALKGTDVKGVISQLENYVNRQVYGNLPNIAKMQIAGVTINVDNMLDASGQMIHMIHLAANSVLGAKNMSSQAIKLFTNSLVNAMSGNDQFTPAQAARAVQEILTNHKKVVALNKKYQIVNITERDLLNHFTKNATRKNIFETEFQMIFHWFGDHYTQLIGAMAQMMQDGTYDAHDNDGNYDMSKDKRFQKEDGELIKKAIIRQQFKENYHVPVNGQMTHAYSQRQENRVKVIVQRYVSELNDSQYKNMVSSYGVARAVMSLKTYMYNVKQNWFKVRRGETQLGDFHVIERNGKKEVAWDPVMVEGVLQTWMYLGKSVSDSLLGKGWTFEMDAMRKRNLIHTATTITVIAGIYFLVDLMTEGFDDDEDKRKKNPDPVFYGDMLWKRFTSTGYVPTKDQEEINYLQQLLRYILGGAANEQLSYAMPNQIVKEWQRSPNPYLWQVKNTWEALTTFLGLPRELYDDEQGAAADVEQLFYAMSKTIPFGNNYRTLRNAYMKISEDVIDESMNANFKPD